MSLKAKHPFSSPQRTSNRGQSLIELLFVFAIAALLVAASLPDLGFMAAKHRVDVLAETFERLIVTTRSHAITGQKIASLCPYGENSCGDDWSKGVILFTDQNNNGEIDDKDQMLEAKQWAENETTIQWRASAGRNYLRYSPTGMARQFGKFHLCNINDDKRLNRSLVVNRQGRVKRYRDSDDDGIVDDGKGNTPQCG